MLMCESGTEWYGLIWDDKSLDDLLKGGAVDI